MKKKRYTHARGPIGLDLGDRVIKAAQVEAGDPPTLTAAVALERSEPDQPLSLDEACRLREVLDRRGFVGRQVVLNVPGKHALTSVLSLPPRKEGVPMDEIARSEMAHEHRLEPGDMEMAYWDLPTPARAGAGTHVMAVACTHTIADQVIEVLQRAGFDVVGLDMEGWAVSRACRSLIDSSEGIVAAVDLGWDSTTLILLNENVVVYERSSFGAGMHQLRQTIEREHQFPAQVIDYLLRDIGFELDMRGQDDDWKLALKTNSHLETHFEQVTRELVLSIDYAHSQYPQAPVHHVLLLGGGAGIPGLTEHLVSTLETQVTVVRPCEVVSGADRFVDVEQEPSLVLSIGLAQQADTLHVVQKGAA